jgi:UDP-N-acetylmuramate dehydrogenase
MDMDTIREFVSLRDLTTLGVGGEARYFFKATTDADILAAVAFAKTNGLSWFVLGGGSNVLVPDDGYSGLVIQVAIQGRQYHVQDDGSVVATIGSGEVLDEVVAETVGRSWWGLENLSHIPGTVGATPIQNVGAYGVEVADRIVSVQAIDTEKMKTVTLTQAACQFGYRDSYFKKVPGRYIITNVSFKLSVTPQPVLLYKDLATWFASYTDVPTVSQVRNAVMEIRSHKFPDWTVVGTAGSFFKNPIVPQATADALQKKFPLLPCHSLADGTCKIALGYVLDKVCQLKGFSEGGVGLYKDQALVLVTDKNNSAQQVEKFAANIIERVQVETGLTIEWEVTRMQ